MDRHYRTHEFADLAGVTVRTLHHYDRIGLLKPQRSSSGDRLYSLADLEPLEQIAALKFLGIPLKEIKGLLGSCPVALLESLRVQLRVLTEKRELIDRAINAIDKAETAVGLDQASDAAVLRKIIEAVKVQPEGEFMRRYYTEQAWAKKAQLREQTSPQTQEGYKQAWKQLFLKVEAALDFDPGSDAVQLLAQRWAHLAETITGGDAEVTDGAIAAWKDHLNWPLAEQDALFAGYSLDPGSDRSASMRRVEQVGKFIGRAIRQKYQSAVPAIRFAVINN